MTNWSNNVYDAQTNIHSNITTIHCIQNEAFVEIINIIAYLTRVTERVAYLCIKCLEVDLTLVFLSNVTSGSKDR